MKLIDEKFTKYILENLCRAGGHWKLYINNLEKIFDETIITKKDRVEFFYKKEIQSSLLISQIRFFRVSETGFLFEYASPSSDKVQTVEIKKI